MLTDILKDNDLKNFLLFMDTLYFKHINNNKYWSGERIN